MIISGFCVVAATTEGVTYPTEHMYMMIITAYTRVLWP